MVLSIDPKATVAHVLSTATHVAQTCSGAQDNFTRVVTGDSVTSVLRKSGDSESCVLPASMRQSATADNEGIFTAAVSPDRLSHTWAPLSNNVHNSQRMAFDCGNVSVDRPLLELDFTLSDCAIPEWESNKDIFVEQLENVENVHLIDTEVPLEVFTKSASQMGAIEGLHSFGENTPHSPNYHQLLKQEQEQHNVTDSHIRKNTASFQAISYSPFRGTFGANTPQQSSGAHRQHNSNQHHHHYHHHNNNHNNNCNNNSNSGQNNQPHQTLVAARRSHRRRGFGAAAVEVIQRRTLLGTSSPQPNPIFTSIKGRKQQGRSVCCGEQKCRSSFQVPLPRSKSRLLSVQEATTPVEGGGEVIAGNNVCGSDIGSTVAAEISCNAFRLSNIAPFYECAIQQLIIECERRVANVSEAARGVLYHQGLNSFQKKQLLPRSVSTRSFDMQPSLGYRLVSVSPLKVTPPIHSFSTRIHSQGGEFFLKQQNEMEEPLDSFTTMGTACCGERRCDGEGKFAAAFNGGLFTIPSDETAETGATSTMVQQLIGSIGLHVAYGDAAPMVLIGALVYLSRITLQSSSAYSCVTTANWYRLVAIAILIASKMYVDGSRRWNECFANATGLLLKEVNKLELDFLFLVDFDLLIKEEEVEAWADWMESVARRRGMSTPLRGFIFGGNSVTPSNATTPMSSFAGDDIFPRSLTHVFSGNWPSTPLSFTPASMTPQINGHASPAALKPTLYSRRSSMSFALEPAEKLPGPSPKVHHSPSPLLHPCETPNPFPPSPLHAPMVSRRTERLFSVVHAPQEPLTPPSLQQLSLLLNDAPMVFSPTPPDQEHMSPVGFFRRSSCLEHSRNNNSSLLQVKNEADICPKDNSNDNVPYSDFYEMDWGQTPPHRSLNTLSPPNTLFSPLCAITPENGDNKNGLQTNTNGVDGTTTTTTTSSVYPHRHMEYIGTFQGAASRGFVHSNDEIQDMKETAPSMTGQSVNFKGGKLKKMISQMRGVFDVTRSFMCNAPLGVLKADTDYKKKSDTTEEITAYNDSGVKYNNHNVNPDEFVDDYESEEDNIFIRRNRMATHSPLI